MIRRSRLPKTLSLVRIALYLTLLLGLLTTASPIFAQSSTDGITDDEVNAIAKDLYCPICESTPLDVCPTQACADWREVIRTKLSQGENKEQIRDYFEVQYGPRALSQPPASGFTLAIWILPIAAIVVGGFLFSRYMRRIRGSEGGEIEDSPRPVLDGPEPSADDYEARIERELQEK